MHLIQTHFQFSKSLVYLPVILTNRFGGTRLHSRHKSGIGKRPLTHVRIASMSSQQQTIKEKGRKQTRYSKGIPDYTRRQSSCKHLIAVMATEDMTQEIIAESGV